MTRKSAIAMGAAQRAVIIGCRSCDHVSRFFLSFVSLLAVNGPTELPSRNSIQTVLLALLEMYAVHTYLLHLNRPPMGVQMMFKLYGVAGTTPSSMTNSGARAHPGLFGAKLYLGKQPASRRQRRYLLLHCT